MSKICFGCGVKLQCTDQEKEGFVPVNRIENADYCMNCFKLIHYGVIKKSDEPKKSKAIIESVNKNAHFVVFLMDFIDVFKDSMDLFRSIRVPKILVISKSDIIPKNVSFDQIRTYLKKVYSIREDILFTSNKSNLNTLRKALKDKDKDEIYFLGLTNSGKSTLINALIDKNGIKMNHLATSYKENTTQDFVRIKIGNQTIVDSPGFVISNFELDKRSNIKSEIKPVTYQNKTDCTYLIGNAFPIKFSGSGSLVFYFSKDMKITREYNKEMIGTSFRVKGNSDIVICGLGFIKVTDDVTVTISLDIMKYINIRPSMVGGKYE